MKKNILHKGSILLVSFGLISMTIIKTNPQEPWEVPTEYENMKNPYAGMEDEERIGHDLYSKFCKFCHGNKGKGDGAQANLVETPVADFSLDSFKNQTDGSLYYKISKGRVDMPNFEKIIADDEDMWMVINYIKSF